MSRLDRQTVLNSFSLIDVLVNSDECLEVLQVGLVDSSRKLLGLTAQRRLKKVLGHGWMHQRIIVGFMFDRSR